MGLLNGQICIVTGAGQGLGRAIALEMSREGATVVLIDRNPNTLVDVAEEIARGGGNCSVHAFDVTDYDAYARTIADVEARHGRIDTLVNNAGINPATKSILDDTLEEWRRTIAINLEAVYMGSKLVAPIMARQNSGRIIHISSIQGFASSGLCGSYNAAKGALIAYTKSMAVELAPHNILVNAVAPGFMVTPMSVVNGVDETTTPEFVDWYIDRRKIALGRSGLPEDVSGTVVFLASDYCRYMTGQLLVVDGGLMSTF
ncbi:MAG: SDR family oxidoreductase [Aestuariivirga sp.]|uniref:SDR family NAD(P)-dependent oxidoreductase n=1 Tax=Aestuariivirga sp. TaxID=2650926 RepID=UPI0025C7138A|nr:SDR family oxidoreductase [Aestuariivirga sp.]MCA3561906.1 SDR family oxidoreductase [Aestuariivirga sp.]